MSHTLPAGGRHYPAWIEDGLVHVYLPFAVDLGRLSALLQGQGLFLAHGEEEALRTGRQGWGERPDPQDYLPYWVEPDGRGGTVFAFPPRDYEGGPAAETDGGPGFRPVLGPGAAAVLAHWLPLLSRARAGEAGERVP